MLRGAALVAGNPEFSRDRVKFGTATIALDLGYHLPLRFYGPRGTFETLSASDLLSGEPPVQRLKGRIVVVGVTATGIGDKFGTPFDPIMPGVEVLATGIAQLTGGDGLVRDLTIRKIDAAATVLLTLGAVLVILLVPVSAGLALVAGAAGLWTVATVLLFGQGYWLSAVLPLAGVLPAAAAATVFRQISDRRHTREVVRAEAALRQFQSPMLAKRIALDPNFLNEPVGRMAAILFVDLAGFTGLSEQLGPIRTRELLKPVSYTRREQVDCTGRPGDEFHGRRCDDRIRCSGSASGRRIPCVRYRVVPDRRPAGVDRPNLDVWSGARRPPWRALWARRGIAARPRSAPAHHGDRRYRQCRKQTDRGGEVARAALTLALSTEFFEAVGEARARRRQPEVIRDVEIRGRLQHVNVALWD